MYRYCWILEDKLAVSPQPFEENIEFLSEIFDAVIVLLEPDELMYDLEEWRRRNVDVMHVPVPPLYIPALLELYKMTLWISEKIKSGKKVLVHCYGGVGRSRTVAAAYLIFSEKMTLREACERVSKEDNEPVGFLELWLQENILAIFEKLVSAVTPRELNAVLQLAERYNYGTGIKHASRVTELAISLFHQLKQPMNLNENLLKPLIFASALHDIGYKVNKPNYHTLTLTIIEQNEHSLRKALTPSDIELTKWTALHHSLRAGDPRKNLQIPENIRENVAKLSAILRIADALDTFRKLYVNGLTVSHQKNKILITVYGDYEGGCRAEIRRAYRRAKLASQILGKPIKFTYGGWTPRKH